MNKQRNKSSPFWASGWHENGQRHLEYRTDTQLQKDQWIKKNYLPVCSSGEGCVAELEREAACLFTKKKYCSCYGNLTTQCHMFTIKKYLKLKSAF